MTCRTARKSVVSYPTLRSSIEGIEQGDPEAPETLDVSRRKNQPRSQAQAEIQESAWVTARAADCSNTSFFNGKRRRSPRISSSRVMLFSVICGSLGTMLSVSGERSLNFIRPKCRSFPHHFKQKLKRLWMVRALCMHGLPITHANYH